MGDEQREALARLFVEDEGFKAAIMGATSVDDAIRVAGEHGIDATAEDFAPQGPLGDSELEAVSGGIVTLNVCWGTHVPELCG